MRRLLSLSFIAVLVLFGVFGQTQEAWAKDKAPKEYQQGKLLDIQEKKDKTTTYTTTKQKDGTTVTTPTTTEQKHYFITVQVGDLVYVSEYTPMFFGKPGDWIVGDPIDVRFDGNKMILRKPNGKELKAGIRKRIRASEYRPGE
ncbi:hypothetical protein FBR05_12715 [Deltaproteobacteria bacterium PRO3]|nr:hypothetical protein [Deltaproteobacteria bacterium PRO3]